MPVRAAAPLPGASSPTCWSSGSRSAAACRRGTLTGNALALAAIRATLSFLHLGCLNRGVLLTPFHNMALFSPSHTEADVDRHTDVFGDAVTALLP